jgi:hypothetical protein
MTRKVVKTVFAAAAASLVLAGLAFAKAKDVNITYTARLGSGPEIQAGSYKVDVITGQPTPEVVFYKGGEIVAKAPAKLVELPKKADYTQILFTTRDNSRVITEMRVSGWKERLVFEESEEPSRSGQ